MSDSFKYHQPGLESPAIRHFSITPSDSADIDPRPRVILVSGGGDVVVRDEVGTEITYTLEAGDRLEFRAVRILATGTTATGIVGWI